MSRVLDWTDRATCVLFGDGAGAALLSAAEPAGSGPRRGIVGSILRCDGTGSDVLKIAATEGSPRPCVRMDGRATYNFAVRVVTELVEEIAKTHGIRPGDLKAIIPHQANARILMAAARRLGLPLDLFYINMDRVANTSAASIPIGLAEMSASGRLARGDLVLTLGFGGGLTWGANLIRW
jgi:3-oxoacyl-[acyl-carrier-protein] synthase-3